MAVRYSFQNQDEETKILCFPVIHFALLIHFNQSVISSTGSSYMRMKTLVRFKNIKQRTGLIADKLVKDM